MGMTVVSVRIEDRVKKILEEAGINIGEAVRNYLRELAWRIELERRLERFEETTRDIPPAEKGYSERSVREDREGN